MARAFFRRGNSMALRCAIIGLEPIQKDWMEALGALAADGTIVPVAAGHRTLAAARDIGDVFKIPAFDDLRQLLPQTTPQIIVLDRPPNATIDFLCTCARKMWASSALARRCIPWPNARAGRASSAAHGGALHLSAPGGHAGVQALRPGG